MALTAKAQKPHRESIIARALGISSLRLGLFFLIILLIAALFAPVITGLDPKALGSAVLASPGGQHPLGTDQFGRDLFTRILYGARTSLTIGFLAAGISGVIGIVIGAISGYFGGKVDQALSFFISIFDMTPMFFLILIVIALFGGSILNVVIVIGLTTWTANARLMRAQTVSLRDRVFVQAAVTVGEGKWRILLRHVVPNGIYPLVVNTTANISAAILMEASLSFIGLGDPNIISWGQIVLDGRSQIVGAWWISTFGGLAIVLTAWTFFLLGDGLNRLITPKLHTLGR
ncbi:MAG: ABC transporter permease [Oscillospiraceae bacterium]|nr:ABC transporter permease [Oscillospiraceae bacterium]